MKTKNLLTDAYVLVPGEHDPIAYSEAHVDESNMIGVVPVSNARFSFVRLLSEAWATINRDRRSCYRLVQSYAHTCFPAQDAFVRPFHPDTGWVVRVYSSDTEYADVTLQRREDGLLFFA